MSSEGRLYSSVGQMITDHGPISRDAILEKSKDLPEWVDGDGVVDAVGRVLDLHMDNGCVGCNDDGNYYLLDQLSDVVSDACVKIRTAIMYGDEFHSRENREKLRRYMREFDRCLNTLDVMNDEVDMDAEEE